MDDALERIGALRDEVAGHVAAPVLVDLDALNSTFSIFRANADELLQVLDVMTDPANAKTFWDAYHRSAMNEGLLEVGRVLHNYVAAVVTLLEHTRPIVRR